VTGLLKKLEVLSRDRRVAGIFLNVRGPAMGLPALRHLGKGLERFHDSGKKIICYLEGGGLGSWYLAAHADSIYMPESAMLDLHAPGVETLFFGGLLSKLGIQMEVIAAGRYKSALEQIAREGFSEPAREALRAVLEDLMNQMESDIARLRGVETESIRKILENGPYDYRAALEAGLVDGPFYYNDREERLREITGLKHLQLRDLKQCRFPGNYDYEWEALQNGNYIALIRAEGPVVDLDKPQKSFPLGSPRKQVTFDIARQLREARQDPNVAAVVMWIDSPGGAIMASDIIWHEMKKYHDPDVRKPLIAVMGSVAGSGGYYIACQADTIIADPTTITGSIGVISGKLNFRGLMKTLGITMDTLRLGAEPRISSPYRPFREEERKMTTEVIRRYYELFLSRVSEGRGLSRDEVHQVAEGRIWSGLDAREHHLVDLLGNLDDGIALAAELAGITDTNRLVDYTHPESPLPLPVGLTARTALPSEVEELLRDLQASGALFGDKPLFLMPLTPRRVE